MTSFGRIKKDHWGNIVIVDNGDVICGFGCRRDASEKTYYFWEDNVGRDCEFRVIKNSHNLSQYKNLGSSLVVSFLDEEDFPERKRKHSPSPVPCIDERKIKEKYKDILRVEIKKEMREEMEELKIKAARVETHMRSLREEYTEIIIENEKNKAALVALRETLDQIRGLSTTFN